jgi:hypothetical protein
MNGKPDTLKGSYYANPVVDHPKVSDELRKQYPESYNGNIWPAENDIPGFQDSFKNLGGCVWLLRQLRNIHSNRMLALFSKLAVNLQPPASPSVRAGTNPTYPISPFPSSCCASYR